MMEDDARFLRPTWFLDYDNDAVISRAKEITAGAADDRDRAVRLYYAVRDGFRYNPYRMSIDRSNYRASFVLGMGEGFCVQKAVLLAAFARAVGIHSRLRFANVRNHLATKKLIEAMKTDLFVFHGYNELLIDGVWLKCTPAFNLTLCEKFDILPLEFDGRRDSVFHPFDRRGNRHMEYIHDYGWFDDLPFDLMVQEFTRHYPHLVGYLRQQAGGVTVDFECEAADERRCGGHGDG